MRNWAKILCLLAAATGTPLRQAEAADDLSRALAKLFQPAHIETPDGRVGDDSGVGTLEHPDPVFMSQGSDGVSEPVAFLPVHNPSQFAQHVTHRRRHRAARPPSSSSRDRAWLGVFLF
jgi:hypothetical protein